MIPAGYMFKKVALRPEWLKAPNVVDVYSLSGCISEYFAPYIRYWKHNDFWLFNSPSDMNEILADEKIDRASLTLFYYEAFEEEFDENESGWSVFAPDVSFSTDVVKPIQARFHGYDLVSFSNRTCPECSPLSCNAMAEEIPTNSHCLTDSVEDLRHALESGKFKGCEPGPYRIFSVYSISSEPNVL